LRAPIIILGIDPGLRMTGFGVVEKNNDKIRYLGSGVIKTVSAKEDARDSLPERIQIILKGLFEVIDQYRPKQVAIEKVFVNINPQSTLLLGQARGAAISAAVIKEVPVYEYTALQVKKSVVGSGHAKKKQVQEMVKRFLKLPEVPQADSADALACAICHAHAYNQLQNLNAVSYRMKKGRLV
jgi:crossover junction endodeoxyribonuclease RuvC